MTPQFQAAVRRTTIFFGLIYLLLGISGAAAQTAPAPSPGPVTGWKPCDNGPGEPPLEKFYCRGNLKTRQPFPSIPWLAFVHNSQELPGLARTDAAAQNYSGLGPRWSVNIDGIIVRRPSENVQIAEWDVVEGDGTQVRYRQTAPGSMEYRPVRWGDTSTLKGPMSITPQVYPARTFYGFIRRVDDILVTYTRLTDDLFQVESISNAFGGSEDAFQITRRGATRLIDKIQRGSKVVEFSYNAAGKLAAVVDPDKLQYGVQINQSLDMFSYPNGESYSYSYDREFNIISIIDNLFGGGNSITYYPSGVLKSITNGGQTTNYEYGPEMVTIKGLEGEMRIAHANQAYTEIKSPLGTWKTTWDTNKRLRSLIDPQGRGTFYTWDYNNDPNAVKVVYPDGQQAIVVYRELLRKPLQITDSSGVTRFQWTDDGRLLSEQYPSGLKKDYEWSGPVITKVSVAGPLSSNSFSNVVNGKLIETVGPFGDRVKFQYQVGPDGQPLDELKAVTLNQKNTFTIERSVNAPAGQDDVAYQAVITGPPGTQTRTYQSSYDGLSLKRLVSKALGTLSYGYEQRYDLSTHTSRDSFAAVHGASSTSSDGIWRDFAPPSGEYTAIYRQETTYAGPGCAQCAVRAEGNSRSVPPLP